jgi:Na+/melibiose symporter-like transporter
MSQRKQYLIDKKFQLKHTFSIIGIVGVITLLITIFMAVNIYVNSSDMKKNNEQIENLLDIEDNIVHYMTSRTLGSEDEVYKEPLKRIAQQHSTNMITLQEIMKTNTKIVTHNNWLLIVIIVVIFIGSGLLYFQLIRKTHQISGPIYVISRYMRQLIDGEHPTFRDLRDNDELKDFYILFKELIQFFKGKKT